MPCSVPWVGAGSRLLLAQQCRLRWAASAPALSWVRDAAGLKAVAPVKGIKQPATGAGRGSGCDAASRVLASWHGRRARPWPQGCPVGPAWTLLPHQQLAHMTQVKANLCGKRSSILAVAPLLSHLSNHTGASALKRGSKSAAGGPSDGALSMSRRGRRKGSDCARPGCAVPSPAQPSQACL